MRIIVKESKGRELKLSIPTVLILNRFTAGLAARSARQHGVLLSNAQMRTFIKALHRYRRAHPDWILLEAVDGNDWVKILP